MPRASVGDLDCRGVAALACGSAWGHDGDQPGYSAYAFASRDGDRQFVLLYDTDPESLKARAPRAILRVVAGAYCR